MSEQILIKNYPSLPQNQATAEALYEMIQLIGCEQLVTPQIIFTEESIRTRKGYPTTMKKIQEKLKSLAGHLDKTIDLLIDKDITEIMTHINYMENNTYYFQYDEFTAELNELRHAINKLVSLKGKIGNRHLPDCADNAVCRIVNFWQMYVGNPEPFFRELRHRKNKDYKAYETYEAGNEFTKFACDVLTALFKDIGLEQCRTLLQSQRFKK